MQIFSLCYPTPSWYPTHHGIHLGPFDRSEEMLQTEMTEDTLCKFHFSPYIIELLQQMCVDATKCGNKFRQTLNLHKNLHSKGG